MGDKVNYKILFDFSKGKYSYNDYLKVKHWFNTVKDDKEAEQWLFDQWKESSDDVGVKSLRPIYEKIQYQILLEEKKNEQKKNIFQLYRQVAAILVPLLVISASIYFFTQPSRMSAKSWVEISVPEGSRVEFLLPDSTSGWLNSGAKLKYPTVFGRSRKVELIGEAFFNVKHLNGSDFTVGVQDMDIRVLGTKFNVAAYENDAVTDVVLKEGKVELKGRKAAFNQILLPGEKISFNHKKNSISKQTVDPNLYVAWTNGCLVIDNEPFIEVAKKFERWYNVDISIPDEALKNFRFRATFKEEPLEEVLRYIAITTPITYEIGNRGQNLNGILEKKHVTIKLKQ